MSSKPALARQEPPIVCNVLRGKYRRWHAQGRGESQLARLSRGCPGSRLASTSRQLKASRPCRLSDLISASLQEAVSQARLAAQRKPPSLISVISPAPPYRKPSRQHKATSLPSLSDLPSASSQEAVSPSMPAGWLTRAAVSDLSAPPPPMAFVRERKLSRQHANKAAVSSASVRTARPSRTTWCATASRMC